MTVKLHFQARMKLFKKLILSVIVVMAAVLAMLFLTDMEDSACGRGVVQGLREYTLLSATRSHITEILKGDGDSVVKGDIIMQLDDRSLQEKITVLNCRIRELQGEIEVEKANLALLKLNPLPKEYRHTEIAMTEFKIKSSKSCYELKTYQKLYKRNVISKLELDRKELEHLNVLATARKHRADYIKIQKGLAKRIINQAAANLNLMELKLESKRQELLLLKKHKHDYVIRAPEAGLVSYVMNKPGSYVKPGDILVRIAAGDTKVFTVFVNEKSIYKVKEGQPARIVSSQYSYFEHGYFEGEVMDIEELPETRPDGKHYPVIIKLTSEPMPLRLGSTGEASIITGRERIICRLLGSRN
ncbi:HlyD family efflux transporter periplasmic adaptor subunit [Lentisphaerota bacterium ZTH]|nr:HlyD family efflux transporter periplasmic adaptor subunit [Lentisphaerota bacterium]WET06604.1 HlyD family efflux transporter periplasmic adaptor subunit [Lentisphaerota bacterium ZTH]